MTPPRARQRPVRTIARIVDDEEASLVDLIDNLLERGVMLNADLILALADVDLIYVRLSALLCAADRIVPQLRGSAARARSSEGGPVPPKPRSSGVGPVPPKLRSSEGG